MSGQLTSVARALSNTIDAMIAPCSVNAKGANSSAFNWNMKSSGKRSRLRLTCWLSRLVVSP